MHFKCSSHLNKPDRNTLTLPHTHTSLHIHICVFIYYLRHIRLIYVHTSIGYIVFIDEKCIGQCINILYWPTRVSHLQGNPFVRHTLRKDVFYEYIYIYDGRKKVYGSPPRYEIQSDGCAFIVYFYIFFAVNDRRIKTALYELGRIILCNTTKCVSFCSTATQTF